MQLPDVEAPNPSIPSPPSRPPRALSDLSSEESVSHVIYMEPTEEMHEVTSSADAAKCVSEERRSAINI